MIKNILALITLLSVINFCKGQTNSNWTKIATTEIPANLLNTQIIKPAEASTFQLNYTALKSEYETAPLEFATNYIANALLISLPNPNGTFEQFKIWESPVVASTIGVNNNSFKTYTGQGITDPTATVKIDYGTNGFHAMVLTSNGDIFIDPISLQNNNYYQTYYRKHFNPIDKAISICKGLVNNNPNFTQRTEAGNGTQLKTYRLAVACTHQYSAFFGGTLAATSAAIATSINRVNGMYEKELAVRLVLVANNNLNIYTTAAGDPFTGNDDPNILIDESQVVIDNNIGNGNYDVGHTFSTGAGGLAYGGVVCNPTFKAKGVTGSSSPVGDPYDIDYVAHEIGHQFDGDHTFNSNISNCGGGNRTASAAYEVGSGSTILAYAGICGSSDLQPNSDAYFHTYSFDQLTAHISGSGGTCAAVTATGNSFPVVSTGTGGFTIPKNTPFTLKGSATDANGDALTYCWEQFDLGPAGINTATSTSGPNFRSYSPTTSPTRTIPRIADIATNTSTFREVLYNGATDRTFNFRLIARDNRAAGGGVNYTTLTFVVSGTAANFAVTAPNTAVSWAGNSMQTVSWNVNGTNIAPLNGTNVKITLSTDGGLTYPTVILASTPNDGTETITVPNVSTSTARIRVECEFSNYSFFDISNTNFTINLTTPVTLQSFTAYKNNSDVLCNWATATEQNLKQFEVEKSSNGIAFTKIATILSNGINSNIVKKYSYTDKFPYNGNNYYRLLIIDKDGKFAYSPIKLVKFGNKEIITLSPNPANGYANIATTNIVGNTSIKIFNTTGKLIFNTTINATNYIDETINTSTFANGIYFVKIENNTTSTVSKLIVQH